jgi:hypothetical protein
LPAKLALLHDTTGSPVIPALLNPRAATVDQNSQDDNNQHAGNYPGDRDSIHIDSSFP